jgi:hypothetical protein
MKRLLVESLMAGAFVFLLVRAPLDLMLFDAGPAPQFLTAGPGLDGAAAAAAASWAWLAGAAAALLTLLVGLVVYGARGADRRHAEAVALLSPATVRARDAAAASPLSWRPRANAYAENLRRRFVGARPASPRKIVDARPRRAPRAMRRRS